MKTLERASLAAVCKKASTGHMGTLKALSNAGASLAMKKATLAAFLSKLTYCVLCTVF